MSFDTDTVRNIKELDDELDRLKTQDETVFSDAATKGSLIVGNSTPAWDELAIGTDNQVLVTDSLQSLGVKWIDGGAILISETVLTGPVVSITFSSIPQTFRSLLLINQASTDRAAADSDRAIMRFNADAGNNYDFVWFYERGDNTRAASGTLATSGIEAFWTDATGTGRASNYPPSFCLLPGYATANREKWVITPISPSFGAVGSTATLFIFNNAGRWRSTAAMISITLLPNLGTNFVADSIFQLYGLQ